MEPPEHLPYLYAPFRGTPVGRAQDLLQKRGQNVVIKWSFLTPQIVPF